MALDLWPIEHSPFSLAWKQARAGAARTSQSTPAIPAPEGWRAWLEGLFPRHVGAGFAPHHEEFWEHVESIQIDSRPDPFVGIWGRGGAKSSSVELGVTRLGVENRRRYFLYVRETQDMADKSVANIGALLSSDAITRHYPDHADKAVNKFGAAIGWRRNRLVTAGGMVVDALGLDTASRGLKFDDQRPDCIILDDIDGKLDSPTTTAKKIATITTSILPAGSGNVAVLAIQNLIIPDGVFTRMVDGRADYLARRIVSGPHPAIRDLTWEWRDDVETGTRRAIITGGTPSWQGQDLRTCQHMIDTIGIHAFLKECQHEVTDRSEGLALKVEPRHQEALTDEEARELVALGQPFAGLDFGDWRFGFVFRAADTEGRLHQIGEYFSQRETLEHRAKVLHCILTHYGAPSGIRQRGDAANPTDIREINQAFRRIGSPFKVHAVTSENKSRKTAVERVNDLLDRDALLYRKDVMEAMQRAVDAEWKLEWGARPNVTRWMLGYNVSSSGMEMIGSRLWWEVHHWGYPVPKEGEAQKQDPDDHTADGADLIAADRYAIMSQIRPGKEKEEPKERDRNEDDGLEKLLERMQNQKRRRR